ncbi:pheST operon leader peptide PheM [Enterobacteriaceae bacterium 4M9]|nr:pheST operon leader peptide PheM [Enterobacteriaceae bacterium 4M9]
MTFHSVTRSIETVRSHCKVTASMTAAIFRFFFYFSS